MSDDNGENDDDNSDGDDNHGVAMVIMTKMRISFSIKSENSRVKSLKKILLTDFFKL